MNVKELMIDDWVLYDNAPHRIQGMLRKDVIVANWPKDEGDIEPIPLTAEILEKNGFEVTRNMSSSRNKDVWTLRVSKNKTLHIIEHHNKKQFPYFWIEVGSNSDIKYVHQLQHALRLCGIDKEIVL